MTFKRYLDPSGWYFEWDSDNGLVLKNVRHDHYRCANDIRIAGVWAGSHDPNDLSKPKDAVLRQIKIQPPDFQQTDLIAPNDPRSRTFGSLEGFAGYPSAAAVGATYVGKDAALGPGSKSEHLHLFQRFVFTHYGMNPPHEPGAVLPAARIFPLLGFRFIPLGTNSSPVRYLRVDYRLHFNLDSFGFDDSRLRISKLMQQKIDNVANQVGLFRDAETTPFPIKIYPRGPDDFFFAPAGIAEIFAAAEKPLQYEIITRGLTRGRAEFNGRPATWDNLHQWPAAYPGGLPSTPGAFHCLHMHWRWATVAGIEATKLLPAGGQQQFKGIGGAGGPLLDPKIPDQTIRLAVTKNFNSDLSSEVLSTQKFEDLFLKMKAVPDDVTNGGDLVVWMSIEVFRGDDLGRQNPWEGTLFVHGCYFAHDPEPTTWSRPGLISEIGLTRSGLLKPAPAKKWERFAV